MARALQYQCKGSSKFGEHRKILKGVLLAAVMLFHFDSPIARKRLGRYSLDKSALSYGRILKAT